MTNKEAIEQLKWVENRICQITCLPETFEALGLAIKALEERPQGEWIIVKDEKWGDNVKCPFCGKELAGTDLNFCCKCGADMRRHGK